MFEHVLAFGVFAILITMLFSLCVIYPLQTLLLMILYPKHCPVKMKRCLQNLVAILGASVIAGLFLFFAPLPLFFILLLWHTFFLKRIKQDMLVETTDQLSWKLFFSIVLALVIIVIGGIYTYDLVTLKVGMNGNFLGGLISECIFISFFAKIIYMGLGKKRMSRKQYVLASVLLMLLTCCSFAMHIMDTFDITGGKARAGRKPFLVRLVSHS